MFVQPYERPTTDGLLPESLDPGAGFLPPQNSPNVFAPSPNDMISRMQPPAFGGGAFGTPDYGGAQNAWGGGWNVGMAGQLIAVIEQMLQSLAQMIPGASAFTGGSSGSMPFGACGNGAGCGGNEQYFQNASGGSVGDPHLSFQGSTWDNMDAQPDLLNSNSFAGGYRISTQVTPSQNGVTHNQSATITTDYGRTSVSMDASGNPTILQNGMPVPINVGQTLDLGDGESVTRTSNALQVTSNNGMGGQITATMTANGGGVDVQTTAQNVDLGGALVNGPNAPSTPMFPRMHNYTQN